MGEGRKKRIENSRLDEGSGGEIGRIARQDKGG